MEAARTIFAFLALFVLPSIVAYAVSRKGSPRPGSLLDRGSKLALHRAIIVAIVLAAHLLMLFVMMGQPKNDEQPPPGHHYGPAYESWVGNMMMSAILASLVSALSWIAFAVVLVREIILAVRAVRARSRVLREGTASEAPAGATFALDFGVGDATFAFHGAGGDGYRAMKPALSWARGTPAIARLVVAPIVTVATGLAIFGFIGIDLLLSMGD